MAFDTPVTFANPTPEEAAMLDNLQPNIVKPHTRDCLTILFLRFEDRDQATSALGEIARTLMKSATRHLTEIADFKSQRIPGTAYVGVGLTSKGYDFLGIANKPNDASFIDGMQAAPLNDPDPAHWEEPFRQPLHAVILVGDTTTASRDVALGKVESILANCPLIFITGRQEGLGRHNANGDGIEHFGYVDGRSQPLFFTEEIDEEAAGTGTTEWDPAFGPDLAIVPDPAAPDPGIHQGSYFIYRKLEQNVRSFKEQEENMAVNLPLAVGDEERMGAMLVGRFEDGTPATVQATEGLHSPVTNNFNYSADGQGAKCPFFAHIRKTNPRGSGGFEPEEQERLHQMPRRGQTYGARDDGPNDGRIDNKPTGGVGLLFMAFNREIAQQFEFMQRVWANNPSFPRVPPGTREPGIDPIIGQGRNPRPDADFPATWDDPTSMTGGPKNAQVVFMKGGEYFFMPSLPFLRGLAPVPAVMVAAAGSPGGPN